MKTRLGSNGRIRASCAAFTLSEVTVAVMLFAIAGLSGYVGLIQGFMVMGSARENIRATQILQDKTEIVRLYTWDQITNSSFVATSFTDYLNPSGMADGSVGATYYGTVSITKASTTASYAGDLKQVTFQLAWTNNGIPCTRVMSTLVSRYGVHNYIYGSK